MDTKDTAVLDFKINEDDAIASLERYKKSIVDLKGQQAELNKEYKAGTKSLDEYAHESVQLEAQLKKNQGAYSNLQRSVTGIKNPFDKLNDSIKEQAKQVTIAGVSLSTFVNPVTATIGVLGGLFKAYASSTIGAKDLEFASNQLSAATGILANNFASLFSSAKDGEGFFSQALDSVLRYYSPALAATSKNAALAMEAMQDAQRKEISVRADMNERLEENAQKLAQIQDSHTNINDKLALANEVENNLKKNKEDIVAVLNQQLGIIDGQIALYGETDKLLDQREEKLKQISREEAGIERKVQQIVKLKSDLNDADDKSLRIAKEQQALLAEEAQRQEELIAEKEQAALEKESEKLAEEVQRVIDTNDAKLRAEEQLNFELDELYQEDADNERKASDEAYADFIKKEKAKTKIQELEEQNRLMALSAGLGQAQALFEKDTAGYKFLGVARATIDTYVAATAALKYGPILGPILAALMVTAGLANVAKILDIDLSAAAGGGTFVTKGPQLLLVGDNPGGRERVDVTPMSGKGKTVVGKNMIAMAGGGTMFTDSSIMASSMTDRLGTQNLPVPKVILTYQEFKEFTDTVEFKDSIATA